MQRTEAMQVEHMQSPGTMDSSLQDSNCGSRILGLNCEHNVSYDSTEQQPGILKTEPMRSEVDQFQMAEHPPLPYSDNVPVMLPCVMDGDASYDSTKQQQTRTFHLPQSQQILKPTPKVWRPGLNVPWEDSRDVECGVGGFDYPESRPSHVIGLRAIETRQRGPAQVNGRQPTIWMLTMGEFSFVLKNLQVWRQQVGLTRGGPGEITLSSEATELLKATQKKAKKKTEKLKREKQEQKAQIENLGREKQELKNYKKRLEARSKELGNENREQKAQMEKLENERPEQKGKNRDQRAQIEKLENENRDQNAQMEKLENEDREQKNQNRDQRSQIEKLTREKQEQEKENRDREARIEELPKEVKDREARIEKLGQEVKDRGARIEKLEKTGKARNAQIKKLGKEVKDRGARIEKLKREVTDREAQIRELKNENKRQKTW